MDVIIRTSRHPLLDPGIEFFCSKYGFSRGTLERDLPLKIVNTDHETVLTDDITGWIDWKGFSLPVFVPPEKIEESGKTLVFYRNGNTKSPCVTVSNDSVIVTFDIFLHLGLCVSGHLEKIWENQREIQGKTIRVPFADLYADILFACLVEAQATNGLPIVYKAFWPEGKPFAVCLTHDIDEVRKTYQWLTYPARKILRCDWKGLKLQFGSFMQKLRGDEPFWTFEYLADLEDTLGVRSSLFFLHETAKFSLLDRSTWRHAGRRYDFHDPRVRTLIRDLYQRKWDIGLHGSFDSYTDEKLICSEKNQLEKSLGHEVQGGRQHNLNLKIPDTWLNQEMAGLLYDSTLGYNHSIGFRWGISSPFWPYFPEQMRFSSVLQIPLSIEDLPYFRSTSRWDDFHEIYKNVSCVGGMITLLWHHPVFNENEYPGWGEDYTRIIRYCTANNAWIAHAGDVCDWWRRRQDFVMKFQFNGNKLNIIPIPKEIIHYMGIILPKNHTIQSVRNAVIIGEDKPCVLIKTNPLASGDNVEICLTVKRNEA